jgi:hypothetical protein
MKKRTAVVLWLALVAFLVADPSLATAIGRKGIATWDRLKARGTSRHPVALPCERRRCAGRTGWHSRGRAGPRGS